VLTQGSDDPADSLKAQYLRMVGFRQEVLKIEDAQGGRSRFAASLTFVRRRQDTLRVLVLLLPNMKSVKIHEGWCGIVAFSLCVERRHARYCVPPLRRIVQRQSPLWQIHLPHKASLGLG
jgi:hypothetical protein